MFSSFYLLVKRFEIELNKIGFRKKHLQSKNKSEQIRKMVVKLRNERKSFRKIEIVKINLVLDLPPILVNVTERTPI